MAATSATTDAPSSNAVTIVMSSTHAKPARAATLAMVAMLVTDITEETLVLVTTETFATAIMLATIAAILTVATTRRAAIREESPSGNGKDSYHLQL